MLTLIRMAGWDVSWLSPFERCLIDPQGVAVISRTTPDKNELRALFEQFLRFKEHQ